MAKKPTTKKKEEKAATSQQAQVVWNDTDMTSCFANVVNIQSTKDQIDLFFGTNQTWNLAGSPEVTVDLSNRVILTPLVAQRLRTSLGQLLAEHEKRYGAIGG